MFTTALLTTGTGYGTVCVSKFSSTACPKARILLDASCTLMETISLKEIIKTMTKQTVNLRFPFCLYPHMF